MKLYRILLKRIIDFIGSSFGFLLLLPVFLVCTILLMISNNGEAFFVQPRPGKNKRVFKIIKFKTMNDTRDKLGNLLPDSQRLTNIGRFIRKTSLDEIPQLLNVIMGDMSLIGPRPLLVKYLPYYSKVEQKRFSIRPGITGLAQVEGRNLLPWDERLALDVFYVENISFTLDMKILVRTISSIFTSKNVVIDPTSIMLDLDDERKQSNQEA